MRAFVVPIAVLGLVACEDIAMESGRAPALTVTLTDTSPTTSYSAEDAPLALGDDCAEMRPNRTDRQRVILSASDAGGLAELRMDAFVAGIILVDAAPAVTTTLNRAPSGRTFLTMTIPPASDGSVFVNALITLDVTPMPAGSSVVLNAEARDRDGNVSFAPEFTLIGPGNAGLVCRGDT